MGIESGSIFAGGTAGERPSAVVVAVQLPGVTEAELASSIEELERLAKTLGVEPVARIIQRRSKLAPGLVLGEGKLAELASWTGGSGKLEAYSKPGSRKSDGELDEELAEAREEEAAAADAEPGYADAVPPPPTVKCSVVLVDHDLSPTQQRNLEKATDADVLDRTSVILEIFHRHAKTREARLQVEIARLKYLAPRLRESGGGGDRVRGGVGGKGAGESSLELDRRRIRDRIAELKGELAQIVGGSKTRRQRRSDLPTVALVGYTNAGKSSLMRALTSTDVYIADKLFATLDTTVRRLQPLTEPPILITDTVGFIKKLPHDLVASFRSTLDEAAACDLLLHVIDASDPAHADQLAVTREVLGEVFDRTAPPSGGAAATERVAGGEHEGIDSVSTWIVLNKIDRVDEEGRAALLDKYPDALQLSARSPADVAGLREQLIERFAGALEETELTVPWTSQRFVNQIHERTTVLAETHDDHGTLLRVRAPGRVLADLRDALESARAS